MSAAAHCAVIRNPFSTAVANAKIPDGSVALSTTCKYSVSSTISDTTGSVNILLAGGLYCGLSALVTTSAPGATTRVFRQQNFQYAVPTRLPSLPVASGDGSAATPFVYNVDQNQMVPNQYRIVSQGLRISLINNSQDNDGWFEAIRCSPSNSYTDWGIVPAVTAAAGVEAETSTIAPVLDRYEGNGDAGSNLFSQGLNNWAMNPSYIAGKARDLYKHNFILHRQENNDFIEIPQDCQLFASTATTTTTSPRPLTGTNSITPWWVDKQMDSILIRIRSNVSGSNAGNMVLHVHMVQHVEECYDERSELHRFMTRCPINMSLYNATMAAMKRDFKPSIIRSPTMAVATPTYSSYKKKSKRRRR